MNFNDSEQAQSELIIDAMRKDLLSYSMGIYPKFRPNRFARAVCWEIQNALIGNCDRLMIFGPPRHGKQNNRLISTTYKNLDGDLRIGIFDDLQPGYKVLHHTGEFYNVVARNDYIQGNVNVTLDTGETMDVHENHEWLVRDIYEERKARKRYQYRVKIAKENNTSFPEEPSNIWKVIETKELFNNITFDGKTSGVRGSRYRYLTPRCNEVEMSEVEQSIDPYWFGYWLGDGKTGEAQVCVQPSDSEVMLNAFPYKYSSMWTHEDTGVEYYHFKGLNQNRLKFKKITDEYKLCSIEQRKQLLAGLIDSDGNVCQKTGRVRFVNCNKEMIDDVAWIVRSLGWNCYLSSQEPALSSSGVQGKQVVWTLGFNPSSDIPTIYDRKKIKIVKPQNDFIAITGVERIENPTDDNLGFCIQVDSPDNTYVVGETFITTHNSLITSELAPAFFMGNNPDKKIVAASHTATLAEDFGGKVRDNISNPVHEMVFGFEGSLKKSKAAAGNFRTNMNGEYYAVGVGGTPIGKGADVYIIDDPIRGRKDVESESQREDLRNWYSTAVLSRLEGQGTIILMHQRWHEDDLAGWLIKEQEFGGDKWRLVNMPAIIEDEEDYYSDYLQRDYGEALIPELHSKKKLLRLKSTMLPRDWLSMYQQKPRASQGDEFKEEMILRYKTPPHQAGASCNTYIIVDPADSQSKHADYTAMVVIGLGADGNYYILDMIRERLDLAGRASNLIDLHRRWKPLSVGYESYGAQADIQHIQYLQEQENYRFPIVNVGKTNKLKKEERIRRLIPDMTAGRWYAPESLEKVTKDGDKYDPIEQMITEEMIPFPVGKNDDAIDVTSRIYDMSVIWPSSNGNSFQKTGENVISPW